MNITLVKVAVYTKDLPVLVVIHYNQSGRELSCELATGITYKNQRGKRLNYVFKMIIRLMS